MSAGAGACALVGSQLGWVPDKECPKCEQEFASVSAMKKHHSRVHGESLNVRVCTVCGDRFVPRNPKRERPYCSPACHGQAIEASVTLECGFCGATFRRRRSWAERPDREGYVTYCAPICHQEAQKHRPEKIRNLLFVLYVVEDRTIADTARRVSDFGYDAIRKRLIDFGFYDPEADAPLARRMETSLTWDDVQVPDETPQGDDSWRRYYQRDDSE